MQWLHQMRYDVTPKVLFSTSLCCHMRTMTMFILRIENLHTQFASSERVSVCVYVYGCCSLHHHMTFCHVLMRTHVLRRNFRSIRSSHVHLTQLTLKMPTRNVAKWDRRQKCEKNGNRRQWFEVSGGVHEECRPICVWLEWTIRRCRI